MISIIIPTINEAETIGTTIKNLLNSCDKENIDEIIIADGCSNDNTVAIAQQFLVKTITVPFKSRAKQLNAGASIAKSEILFFLHADSIPSPGFTKKIIEAVNNTYHSGCFRLLFDYDHWFLKGNAWFTRFNVNAVRFGDQGLYVTKEIFEKCGGYNENLLLMEDQEIIHRLKKISSFKVVKGYVQTSARRYLKRGVYKTQGIFFIIWLLYYLGASQKFLVKLYRKLS
jgi:rSAM/selenodomain-associated transferase 2